MQRATALTLVSAVLWGATFPVIRYGLEAGDAGPFTFVAIRFLVAGLALAPFVLLRGGLKASLWSSPALWGLALLNAVGYALQFVAQERTTASKTSLLVDIDVVAVALLGFFFLRERHGRSVVFALILGSAGVVLLSTNGDPNAIDLNQREFVGDVLAFVAGLVWAGYFVGLKAYLERHPEAPGLALTGVIVLLTALFLSAPAAGVEAFAEVGNWRAWAAMAFLGIFSTALAFFLWQEALRTLSATVTSILLLVEILVAVSAGALFLGERLTGPATVGALLVVVAAYLAARPQKMPMPALPD